MAKRLRPLSHWSLWLHGFCQSTANCKLLMTKIREAPAVEPKCWKVFAADLRMSGSGQATIGLLALRDRF